MRAQSELPDNYRQEIRQALDQSLSLAIGVFDARAEIVYANAGMRALLGAETALEIKNRFVNPPFERLIQAERSDEPVFQGMITFGDKKDIFRSIPARVFRGAEDLLVIGEYDVAGVDRMNRRMFDLNREIGNLQRELIKEKSILEKTLKELKEAQAMLIHSQKMSALGQLVAGVAHEINNPLGFLRFNHQNLTDDIRDLRDAFHQLETLARTCKDPALAAKLDEFNQDCDTAFLFQDIEEIQEGSLTGLERVKKIVSDLRTFSRLDESEIKDVDIEESIASALAIARPDLERRGIEIRLELKGLPRIHCYASELNQVFMNLIVNAAQAMENGGVLRIRGAIEKEGVRLEFADTGCGIPPDVLPKIFDPFFTTKPVGSGVGLGLSLAHQIVAGKHQGSIRAESRPGEGSVFTLMIPLKAPS